MIFRRHIFLRVVLAGLALALIVFAAGAWWAWRAWTGPGPAGPGGQRDALVRIHPGMTLSAAADTLQARGLLRQGRFLELGARLEGKERSLRAGLFRLEYGQSPRQLLETLAGGLAVQVKITLPEGWNAVEMADLLGSGLGFNPRRFLAVADSLTREAVGQRQLMGSGQAVADHDSLLGRLSTPENTLHWCEGYLAPDTYHFAEGSSPLTVAQVLLETQLARLDSLVASPGQLNPHLKNLHQALTLASIVEAEARRDEERPRIAAVYTNRLDRRWRLEADPTVAFLLGKKGERLFFKDLEVDSPFNTYRRRGLPPGPIGAPGWKSLQAAARPDTSCQALFFVSDGADGHVFSRTIQEHEAAVRRFRRVRAGQRHRESGP
jgi:UPF0755 protein